MKTAREIQVGDTLEVVADHRLGEPRTLAEQFALYNTLDYKAHAQRLADAMQQIIDLNKNRGRGKPIARACNRMVDVAREALAQWENW